MASSGDSVLLNRTRWELETSTSKAVNQTLNSQFLNDRWKVAGFALLRCTNGLKILLTQPSVTRSHTFPRALRQLTSFDIFLVLIGYLVCLCPLWLARVILTLRHSTYETRPQGIMVVVFIRANLQSKIINTTYHDSLRARLTEGILIWNSLSLYYRCVLVSVIILPLTNGTLWLAQGGKNQPHN